MTMNDAVLAEESLFGCILVSPAETVGTARDILQAGDIAQEHIRAAYSAACALLDEKAAVDAVTIQERARADGTEISSETMRAAMRLYVTTANVAKLAEIIHSRAMECASEVIGGKMMSGTLAPTDAIAELQQLVAGQRRTLPTPAEDATGFLQLISDVAEGKKSLFSPTGLARLDAILGGGLVESGVITLAARPGVGKTVVGFAIADTVAATGKKVVYESLEMRRNQLWARRVARMTGLNYGDIMRGISTTQKQYWTDITRAMTVLQQRNLVINDRPASMDDIEAHVRSMGDVGLLVIDHMGLIRPSISGSLYEQTTETSHRLKRLAQSLQIPILSLCQLNRQNENRQDKKPNLSDLRNSGAIEEDSDAVIFLHRPALYWEPDRRPQPWESQEMEFIVAKNRHGMVGSISMDFVGWNARILDRSDGGGFSEAHEPTPFEQVAE